MLSQCGSHQHMWTMKLIKIKCNWPFNNTDVNCLSLLICDLFTIHTISPSYLSVLHLWTQPTNHILHSQLWIPNCGLKYTVFDPRLVESADAKGQLQSQKLSVDFWCVSGVSAHNSYVGQGSAIKMKTSVPQLYWSYFKCSKPHGVSSYHIE